MSKRIALSIEDDLADELAGMALKENRPIANLCATLIKEAMDHRDPEKRKTEKRKSA